MIEQIDIFIIVNHDLYAVSAEAILIFAYRYHFSARHKNINRMLFAELQTKFNIIFAFQNGFLIPFIANTFNGRFEIFVAANNPKIRIVLTKQVDYVVRCTKPMIKPYTSHMLLPPTQRFNYQLMTVLNRTHDSFLGDILQAERLFQKQADRDDQGVHYHPSYEPRLSMAYVEAKRELLRQCLA